MNYIFDFDGTIVDSMGALIAIFNKYVRSEDNPLSAEEINQFRDMTSKKALRYAGVRWWQMPRLALRFMPEFHAMLPNLKTFDGIPEVIEAMHKRGDKLFIVTSNNHVAVIDFLRLHKLDGYFIEAYCGASLFKKSKYIRRLVSDYQLKRKETVYIGDETRDIRAARMARVRPVAVTWGFNSKKILRKQRPTFMVDNPKELLKIKL